ncbi:MAG: alpha/beta fold hydrolase [Planctomycetota bacterium]
MDQVAAAEFPFLSHDFEVSGHGGTCFKLRYIDEGPETRASGTGEPGGAVPSGGESIAPQAVPPSNLSSGQVESSLTSAAGPILCVHGNPTWSFYFRRIVETFSGTRRVIAVDHLGCGRSEKPAKTEFDYCLASHRDNLVALIESLDLRNVTLLAHDWGGAIGLSALMEQRQRFDRVILLNTAAFPPPYIPFRIAACRWPVVGTLAVRGANAFARAAQTMTMARTTLSPAARRAMIAPYDSWAHRVAIDAFVQDIPMSEKHRTHSVLNSLELGLKDLRHLPVGMIWGMKDWCFRPECLRRLQAHWPHAKSVEIEDAGHYVLEDAPQETIDAIQDMLAAQVTAGPPTSVGPQ